MPGSRAAAIRVLAVLFLVSGALSLVGAVRPMDHDSPVGLLLSLGAVGLIGGSALVVLLLRGHAGSWPVHLGLAVLSSSVALLALRSATPVGVVGLGPLLVCLGLYAAHFCSPRVARTHVAAALALATVGALASAAPLPAQPWLINVVATLLVTEVQARLTAGLRYAALHDPLTGLLNRRAWLEAAGRATARAERRGRGPLTVALIDLDGFKGVNDREGHAAGDRLLQELTRAWSRTMRRADALARYGGDEFALLLPLETRRVQRVLARMAAAHPATWSSGVATWEPGDTVDELLHRADLGLYAQKLSRAGSTHRVG